METSNVKHERHIQVEIMIRSLKKLENEKFKQDVSQFKDKKAPIISSPAAIKSS